MSNEQNNFVQQASGGLRHSGARILLAALLAALPAVHSRQASGAYGWAQPEYSVTIATSLARVNDAQAGSSVLTLNHDAPVTIQASATTAGSEVLRSASSDTLITNYMLTGAALGETADADWVSSATFVSPQKSYSVQGTGPSEITIGVRAQTALTRANDAGAYTGSVTLTVTW